MPGGRSQQKYDLALLERLWADGVSYVEIAAALGVSERFVKTLKTRHKLPNRERTQFVFEQVDPTPDEIAERAAAIKARHMADMRERPYPAKANRGRMGAIRVYTRDHFPSRVY